MVDVATGVGQPLRGVRVVDLSQGWAGPLLTGTLAEMGADIVKVESVQRPDWWRGVAPDGAAADAHEQSPLFNGVNRNKRDLTLNLTHPRGHALLLDLVRLGDVLVENFTPHVMESLRLEYAELSRQNPNLIMISMPAYGSSGPWRDHPALGTTVESMCGVQSLTGYEGGDPRMQSTSWDPVVGLHGLVAVLAALRQRRREGGGQLIELAHIEAGIQFVAEPLMEYVLSGRIRPRRGNSSPAMAPHGCYAAAGENAWLAVAVQDDAAWLALCGAIGRPDLAARDDLRTLAGRLVQRPMLDEAIGAWTVQRDARDAMAALQAARVAAGIVSSPADLLTDPHLAARDFFVTVDRPYVGAHPYPGPVVRYSRTPGNLSRRAPVLGEHNEQILGDLLGLTPAEIAELEALAVIGTRPLKAR